MQIHSQGGNLSPSAPVECVNVGIFGGPGGRASRLSRAIASAAASREPCFRNAEAGIKFLSCTTSARQYPLMVFPGAPRVFQRAFTVMQSCDAAVISTSCGKSVESGVLERLAWARAAGVPRVIVCLWTKPNEYEPFVPDPALLQTAERLGYTKSTLDILAGGLPGWLGRAKARETGGALLARMDDFFQPRAQDVDAPFLMPVDDIFVIRGKGTILTGRVSHGSVAPGDELELVGFGEVRQTTVEQIETLGGTTERARPGDHVGLMVRDIRGESCERGMILAAPKTITPKRSAETSLLILRPEEGGCPSLLSSTSSLQFFAHTVETRVSIHADSAGSDWQGDTRAKALLDFAKDVPIKRGTGFLIRCRRTTVAVGTTA